MSLCVVREGALYPSMCGSLPRIPTGSPNTLLGLDRLSLPVTQRQQAQDILGYKIRAERSHKQDVTYSFVHSAAISHLLC